MARILYVEPDKILASTYAKAMEVDGHVVDICTGAQSAIHLADQNTPDLVILELQLIEHSGIEFLYEFRSYPEWQNIPVVILSTVPTSEFVASKKLLVDELGVVEYLYKPQTLLKKLISTISETVHIAA